MRGGKRPGAGAPKGNLNALKHGERSRQFARIGKTIAASPRARALLLKYADRSDAQQRKADELAETVIKRVLSGGLARGRDRLFVLPTTIGEPTIRQIDRNPRNPNAPAPLSPKAYPLINQSHTRTPTNQSETPEANTQ